VQPTRNGRTIRSARDLAEPEMNDDLPLVSMVIPAYNYADYLDEAIESILNQDYPNIELIVLDDGSTDNTREVLEKYRDRFYWETQENMGEADTLNKGWQMSRGEILSRLSADDVMLQGAISTSVKHLLANPDVVLTYCDYDLIDSNSRKVRRVNAPELDYREIVAKFICPPGPGAFFLADAFRATGPWNSSLKLSPDYEYWLRLGLQGRFLRIPEVLAAFRVHDESLSFAATDEQKSDEYVRVISNYYETQPVPLDVLEVKDEALSNAYIFAARAHIRSKRYLLGLKRLYKGLSLYPKNLSVRTARIIAHGLINHVRHGVKQRMAERSRK
jgi:glycosyltransferase involved in cell wall biosynthesis